MLFNSLAYLVFFPTVVSLFFLLPHRFRWALLLAASYYFYLSWKAEYLILIIFSTLVAYFSAIQMEKSDKASKRKFYLALSVVSNLAVLFFFKYLNFVNQSVQAIIDQFAIEFYMPYLHILLPVGISFYTFQTLSYTIDIYWGQQKAERHLGIFALYVSFFPQLVAGPIERPGNLIPQFKQAQSLDYGRISSGIKLMLWGFFKKLVVADRLALYVDEIYAQPEEFSGLSLLLATVLFSFMIYCDFSAYSDIAIGTARCMGYDLMENFRRPYFASSISDFWRRWHISLSTWFRDYLYIPLGGNRVSVARWYLNLLIVFIVSGLWHGANWTFVLWGALHGFYLVLSLVLRPFRERLAKALPSSLYKGISILVTYILVLIAWVFFRANNIEDAFYALGQILTLNGPLYYKGFFLIHLVYAFIAIAILMSVELYQEWGAKRQLFRLPESLTYAGLIVAILLLGVFDGGQFIYFQF
ncbi:MAG: MBOAT family O-acyltransferase [Bacteroidota bacterium]